MKKSLIISILGISILSAADESIDFNSLKFNKASITYEGNNSLASLWLYAQCGGTCEAGERKKFKTDQNFYMFYNGNYVDNFTVNNIANNRPRFAYSELFEESLIPLISNSAKTVELRKTSFFTSYDNPDALLSFWYTDSDTLNIRAFDNPVVSGNLPILSSTLSQTISALQNEGKELHFSSNLLNLLDS